MRCRAYAEVVTQLPVTCGEESIKNFTNSQNLQNYLIH